jgi:HEAT repeat protein
MSNIPNPSDIPFQQIIKALLDLENTFPPRLLYRFSDLEKRDLDMLAEAWADVPSWRRKALIEDIEELGEKDTLLSFEALARFALTDPDPEVRLPAVRTLWEYEDPKLAHIYLQMMKQDPSKEIRSASASALGKYIYLGEIEEISASLLRTIEDELLSILNSEEEAQVRRSALEALGYSSRDEVKPFIKTAYQSNEKEWIASALFAMGRSADPEWKPQVLEKLDSNLPLLRTEAARAAGELEITAAKGKLLDLLDDPSDETRLASIWALSQIGGSGVKEMLERVYREADDEEEIALIESALDNIRFNQDMRLLPILDIGEIESDLPEKDEYEEYEDYFLHKYAPDGDEDFEDDFDDFEIDEDFIEDNEDEGGDFDD